MPGSRCSFKTSVPARSSPIFPAATFAATAAHSCSLRSIHGLGLSRALAACFHDTRDARFVDHSLSQLLAQRLCGLALGYEDLNDHAFLRRDPLLATACDKLDPLGLDRCNPAFRGAALAAPSTLNRRELSNHKSTRCHKLAHDPAAIEQWLLTLVRGAARSLLLRGLAEKQRAGGAIGPSPGGCAGAALPVRGGQRARVHRV